MRMPPPVPTFDWNKISGRKNMKSLASSVPEKRGKGEGVPKFKNRSPGWDGVIPWGGSYVWKEGVFVVGPAEAWTEKKWPQPATEKIADRTTDRTTDRITDGAIGLHTASSPIYRRRAKMWWAAFNQISKGNRVCDNLENFFVILPLALDLREHHHYDHR